ncbi:MAG: hypothetical protein ABR961_15860 [Thermoanaerobaculaceae bacterium]|jgi:hypothetical protein
MDLGTLVLMYTTLEAPFGWPRAGVKQRDEPQGREPTVTEPRTDRKAGRTLEPIPVERVQTGVRLEKRLLKVLKTIAEYHDITLGDLIEGIVLHVFDGKLPFDKADLGRISQLRDFYGLDLRADASHRLTE